MMCIKVTDIFINLYKVGMSKMPTKESHFGSQLRAGQKGIEDDA